MIAGRQWDNNTQMSRQTRASTRRRSSARATSHHPLSFASLAEKAHSNVIAEDVEEGEAAAKKQDAVQTSPTAAGGWWLWWALTLGAAGWVAHVYWRDDGQLSWTSWSIAAYVLLRLFQGVRRYVRSRQAVPQAAISGALSMIKAMFDRNAAQPCFRFTLLNRRMQRDSLALRRLLKSRKLYLPGGEEGTDDPAEAMEADGGGVTYDFARIDAEAARAFVFDFDGDGHGHAGAIDGLRDFVTFVIGVAREDADCVVLRLRSPGGEVSAYGLAAFQLARLRDARVRLVVCVDLVAASGGYLMACVADWIVAAPFSWIGSIGVVAEAFNFWRFLQGHKVDYNIFTAGKVKRTVTAYGEITDAGRKHFQGQMDQVHESFKQWVVKHRGERFPRGTTIDDIATGNCWSAQEALPMGLVDELGMSDDYLEQLKHSHVVIHVEPYVSVVEELCGDSRQKVSTFVQQIASDLGAKIMQHRMPTTKLVAGC